MIDLHTHLLPGIDDGPKTLEQSLEMCRLAVAHGTTHAICTPHIHPGRWENNALSIERDVKKLRGALAENDIALKLGFAGEVRLTDDLFRQVKENDIPFYGEVDGHKVILLEFPHAGIIPGSEKLVHWLLSNKIRPLIAHPERNKQIMRDTSRLWPFLEAGCWLQITAGSIIGDFGEAVRMAARQLLKDNVVTVVASDGHNIGSRKPSLERAFKLIGEKFGREQAEILMIDRPSRIAMAQFGEHATPPG